MNADLDDAYDIVVELLGVEFVFDRTEELRRDIDSVGANADPSLHVVTVLAVKCVEELRHVTYIVITRKVESGPLLFFDSDRR